MSQEKVSVEKITISLPKKLLAEGRARSAGHFSSFSAYIQRLMQDDLKVMDERPSESKTMKAIMEQLALNNQLLSRLLPSESREPTPLEKQRAKILGRKI